MKHIWYVHELNVPEKHDKQVAYDRTLCMKSFIIEITVQTIKQASKLLKRHYKMQQMAFLYAHKSRFEVSCETSGQTTFRMSFLGLKNEASSQTFGVRALKD